MHLIHKYISTLKNTLDNQEGNYAAAYYQYLDYGKDSRFKPDYEMFHITSKRANVIEKEVTRLCKEG